MTHPDPVQPAARASEERREAETRRPLRVLLLLTSTAGGAGLQNYLIAKHLSRDDFELTTAFGLGYPLDVQYARLEIPSVHLNMSRRIAPLTNLRGFFQIWSLLKRGRFDIVCTSCSIAGLMGRVAAALSQVPVVIHVIHVYASQPHQHPAKRWVYRWIERRLDALTTGYVAVSNAAAKYGVDTGIMSADKVEVIFNSIESVEQRRRPRAEVRRELGLHSNAPVIGTVGRCERQKGMRHFLEAAAIVRRQRPEVEFLVVGEGPLRAELQALAHRLDIASAVRFTGWRDDVPDLLGAIDVFCLASLWETFGLALAEAMDAALPVVASDVDGIPEVVIEDETGLLVPPGDAAALADALGMLLDRPEEARRMGEAGKRRLRETFSVDMMVHRYEQLFRRLAEARRERLDPVFTGW